MSSRYRPATAQKGLSVSRHGGHVVQTTTVHLSAGVPACLASLAISLQTAFSILRTRSTMELLSPMQLYVSKVFKVTLNAFLYYPRMCSTNRLAKLLGNVKLRTMLTSISLLNVFVSVPWNGQAGETGCKSQGHDELP